MTKFQLSAGVKESVKSVIDSWYKVGPIDLSDMIDKVELLSGEFLGSMHSHEVKAVIRFADEYRKLPL